MNLILPISLLLVFHASLGNALHCYSCANCLTDFAGATEECLEGIETFCAKIIYNDVDVLADDHVIRTCASSCTETVAGNMQVECCDDANFCNGSNSIRGGLTLPTTFIITLFSFYLMK